MLFIVLVNKRCIAAQTFGLSRYSGQGWRPVAEDIRYTTLAKRSLRSSWRASSNHWSIER